jgi:hypothetical protein
MLQGVDPPGHQHLQRLGARRDDLGECLGDGLVLELG